MKLTITVDAAASLAAGYEPTNTLEIDIASLAPEDRAAIAGIMRGTEIGPRLPSPTLDGLLMVARESAAERQRDEEFKRRRNEASDERVKADRIVLDKILVDRPVTETARSDKEWSTQSVYGWLSVTPAIPDDIDVWRQPDEIQRTVSGWKLECSQELNRRQRAAIDAAVETYTASEKLAAERRAAMSIGEVVADILSLITGNEARKKIDAPWQRVVKDHEGKITLARDTSHPALSRYIVINLRDKTVDNTGVGFSDEEALKGLYDTASYEVSDGVIEITGSQWAALVSDPAAAKPHYNFLNRCPGGYSAEDMQVGDVLVWGSKDRKGRKQGPYDRLIYEIDGNTIRCIKTDYATARKLRKKLVA